MVLIEPKIEKNKIDTDNNLHVSTNLVFNSSLIDTSWTDIKIEEGYTIRLNHNLLRITSETQTICINDKHTGILRIHENDINNTERGSIFISVNFM